MQVEESRSRLALEPDHLEGAEERAELPVAHGQTFLSVAQDRWSMCAATWLAVHGNRTPALHVLGPPDLVAVPAIAEETAHLQSLSRVGRGGN
jgi:hypothetical protein